MEFGEGWQVIFLFLSVVAICSTALFGFKLHLDAKGDEEALSRREFEAMKLAHNNLTRVVTTLANKAGLTAKLHPEQ